MKIFKKGWRFLLQLFGKSSYQLVLTPVMEFQENNLLYRILDNGHDYEVEINKDGDLFYHNTGFSNFQEALSFIEFFRNNLPREKD